MYLSEIPDEFDLRQYTQPARDQGQRGTCAAFTATAIKEINENRDNGLSGWLSPEFIYYHRKNKPASGMYGRNVFQIMQQIGVVPEELYPYSLDEISSPKPPRRLYREAAKYKIDNYARITSIDGLKRALLEIGPCYVMLPLYTTRPKFWLKSKDTEIAPMGHAVAAIGYTSTGFILKNSWGVDWNGDGCIEIPFDEWSSIWECWVPLTNKYAKKNVDLKPGLSVQSIRMGRRHKSCSIQ